MKERNDLFDALRAQAEAEETPPSSEAWSRLEQRLKHFEQRQRRARRVPMFRRQWLTMAAIILVILLILAFVTVQVLLFLR